MLHPVGLTQPSKVWFSAGAITEFSTNHSTVSSSRLLLDCGDPDKMSECHRHQPITFAVKCILGLKALCGITSVMFTAFENSMDNNGGSGVMEKESKSKARYEGPIVVKTDSCPLEVIGVDGQQGRRGHCGRMSEELLHTCAFRASP